MPLPRRILRTFCGSRSTLATSLSCTTEPRSSRSTSSANSRGEFNLPCVRTLSSVRYPSIFPDGSSRFCRCSALRTSIGVRPYPANLTGSSLMRIAYFFSPHIRTPDTPGIVCTRSLITLFAYSLSDIRSRLLL